MGYYPDTNKFVNLGASPAGSLKQDAEDWRRASALRPRLRCGWADPPGLTHPSNPLRAQTLCVCDGCTIRFQAAGNEIAFSLLPGYYKFRLLTLFLNSFMLNAEPEKRGPAGTRTGGTA
jgi:hypothetical protein